MNLVFHEVRDASDTPAFIHSDGSLIEKVIKLLDIIILICKINAQEIIIQK